MKFLSLHFLFHDWVEILHETNAVDINEDRIYGGGFYIPGIHSHYLETRIANQCRKCGKTKVRTVLSRRK